MLEQDALLRHVRPKTDTDGQCKLDNNKIRLHPVCKERPYCNHNRKFFLELFLRRRWGAPISGSGTRRYRVGQNATGGPSPAQIIPPPNYISNSCIKHHFQFQPKKKLCTLGHRLRQRRRGMTDLRRRSTRTTRADSGVKYGVIEEDCRLLTPARAESLGSSLRENTEKENTVLCPANPARLAPEDDLYLTHTRRNASTRTTSQGGSIYGEQNRFFARLSS